MWICNACGGEYTLVKQKTKYRVCTLDKNIEPKEEVKNVEGLETESYMCNFCANEVYDREELKEKAKWIEG